MPHAVLPTGKGAGQTGTFAIKYANFLALLFSLLQRHAEPGRERYRRAGITASTSFLCKGLAIAISLASVPLTVHYLGTERYGVWLTISSLLTWVSLTDFGLTGNALVNIISNAHGKDDTETARQYTASAFWALVALSAILGIIFLIIFHWLPFRTLFRVSEAVSTQELQNACAITLASFLLTFPLSIVNSVYSAYQDGFLWYVWTSVGNALSLLSLFIVTRFHGGLPLLIMAIAGTRIVVSIANAGYMFLYQYPFLKPTLSAVRWICVRNLFRLGSRYTISQLSNLAIYQSQPMIITQFLGPAQAAIFVISQKIVTLPTDLVYMATAPFVSAFGEARARRDWLWIRGAFKNTVILSVVLSAIVQTVIALVARRAILSLAGPALVPPLSVILWLSLYSFVEAAMHPVYQLLCGLERANVLALSLSVCAVAIVGLSIASAHWYGLTGVAVAMAAARLFTTTPIQLHEIRRIFRRAGDSVEDDASQLAV